MDQLQGHSALKEATSAELRKAHGMLERSKRQEAEFHRKLAELRAIIEPVETLRSKLIGYLEARNQAEVGHILGGPKPELDSLNRTIAATEAELREAQAKAKTAEDAAKIVEAKLSKAQAAVQAADDEYNGAKQRWAETRHAEALECFASDLDKLSHHLAKLFAFERLLPPPKHYPAFGIHLSTEGEKCLEGLRQLRPIQGRGQPSFPCPPKWLRVTKGRDLPGFTEAQMAIQEELARILSEKGANDDK